MLVLAYIYVVLMNKNPIIYFKIRLVHYFGLGDSETPLRTLDLKKNIKDG